MQRETWVGIAWAVGLFAAMAAVFVYEAATFELDEFHVSFETMDHGGSATGTLNVGQSASHPFMVDGTNVTFVEVELSWTDPNGGDDTFTIVVTKPDGTTETRTGTSTLTLRVDGVAVPNQEHIEGVDMRHAKDTDLAKPVNATSVAGAWSVQVTLDSAPPVASTGPGGLPNPQGCSVGANPPCDGANAYTLRWRVMTYHATFPSDDEAHEA